MVELDGLNEVRSRHQQQKIDVLTEKAYYVSCKTLGDA